MNILSEAQLVVVPTSGTLKSLAQSLDNVDIPVIDIEVLLTQAIDCLVHKPSASQEFGLLFDKILNLDESICESLKCQKDLIDDKAMFSVAINLLQVIKSVLDKVLEYEMYIGDFFHYEFARIADEDCLLLRRVGGHVSGL